MDRNRGTVAADWWADIPPIRRKGGVQKAVEPALWPTQKPLKLYSQLIETASHKGDMLLDPFAGCATTLVAAERLGRQWVGMDIWEKAHEVVVERLRDTVGLFGDVHFIDQLPERTDDGDTASPFLRVKERDKKQAP